jgi:putative transposase
MPQSLARVWLHIVFSTKHRQPFLSDPELQEEMFRMLGHQAKELACPPAGVGGWIDHVHVVCGLSRTIKISELIESLKRETSKWAKHRTSQWSDFYWQSGYGVFSISQSILEEVLSYVANQNQHHAKLSFQDEFRMLCARHGIEIDERYVWD